MEKPYQGLLTLKAIKEKELKELNAKIAAAKEKEFRERLDYREQITKQAIARKQASYSEF